jgi:radical SAM superfamily enzyme YgiQ (UPF0313 family)
MKVAPEHTSEKVLKIMRKPSFSYFHKFKNRFDKINIRKKLNLQLIPYFISSHPACELEDMADLAAETKDMGFQLEQVQGFTPTPMTVATVIYYSGYHPYTLKKMASPKTKKERLDQYRFFFWYKKEHWSWIKNTLINVKRNDLIPKLISGRAANENRQVKTRNTFDQAIPKKSFTNKKKSNKKNFRQD